MASGSHYGGFFGGGYKIGFDWSSSRAGNENASNITVIPYLYIKSGYTISSSAQKSGTVNINGTNHNFNFTIGSVRGETWVRLASGFTTKVGHNSDGSKTCNLKVSATLNLNLSGSQIGTVSADTNVALDKYNLNSAPTLGGSVSTTPSSGYFSEKATSIPVSWPAASDADGNLSNYYLEVSKNGGGWTALATLGSGTRSYNHSIPAAEGTSYQYRVRAKDSQNAYSGYISSNKITSNTLTGGSFTGTIPSINYGTTSFTMNFSGGKNSDGSSVKYLCYSDNITVYNQTETTGTSQVITIHKSGNAPSGPYIKFDDLKNYLKNSNYNGRLHIGLRTGNGRGTYKYNSTSLSVDLRTNPGAPSSVVIQENSESTAYLTNAGTNNKYFIPDGNKTIKVKWSGGSNPLGGGFTYTVQQILNGKVSTVASGLSSSTKEYTIKPAKLSGNSTATLAFRVQVVADYGNTAQKDSTQITLHSYNGVSFSQGSITRTATEATVNITIKTTSSVPNINTVGTWSCNGKSGNLTVSQAQQSFKITGLTEQGTYTATITYKDNTGWSSNQTASVSIGSLAPIVAITKEGLGVGGAEATSRRAVNVKGSVYPQGSYNCNTVYNAMPEGLSLIDTGEAKNGAQYDYSTIMSVCQSDNRQFQLNVKNDGNNIAFRAAHVNNTGGSASGWSSWKELYHTGKKPTAAEVGALALTGGTLTGPLTISGNSKGIVIGTGGSDVYVHNSASGKYLQLKDNGAMSYTGNWLLAYGTALYGNISGDTANRRIATIASHGGVDLGDTVSETAICSKSAPVWWNGSNSYKIYTTGSKPTASEIGALGNSGTQTLNVAQGKFNIIGNGNRGHIDVQGGFHTRGDSNDIWFERSIMPASWSNAALFLGYSDKRWKAVYAANGTIQTSDIRYKSDIQDVDNEVFYNMIKNTPVHTYVLNDTRIDLRDPDVVPLTEETADQEQIHLGIIAQELDEFEGSKYILNYDEESGYSVNNYNLTSAIMSALKHEISLREQENDELKQKNEELKQEINELKQELAQIKQLLIK